MNFFKDAVEYLNRNCYFSIGDQIFQQIICISMGPDPLPLFTNPFLFHYELQYINSYKKENVISARKFCYTLRFIDDLITINDENFEKSLHNIYPPKLKYKQ